MQESRTIKHTPEQIEKIKRAKAENDGVDGLDAYNVLVCEFGMMYGWQGIEAVLGKDIYNEDGELKYDYFNWLLIGGRKIQAKQGYYRTLDISNGIATAFSKNQESTFNKVVKDYKKKMEIKDE